MANGLDHTDEYLRRLKEFSCELPSNYRVRCTDELLSHLARVLADDTVFLIVRELRVNNFLTNALNSKERNGENVFCRKFRI